MEKPPNRSRKEARELEVVKISIICSVFNAEPFLESYLKSIEEQRLNEFEIIFAESKSTDRSLEILTAYKPRHGITKKLIQLKERVGIYKAWNAAIAASAGTWIINYNCDDHLFPEALAILKTAAEQEAEYDLIYTPCFISDSPTHKPITGYSDWRDANVPGALAAGCCCGPFPIVRKEQYFQNGLFREDLISSGDYEMWCRLYRAGTKMLKLETPIGTYYRNPTGISTTPDNLPLRSKEDLIARTSLLA